MSINLPVEFQGFIRFLARAKDKLVLWYGPHCGHDATKIAFMAAKEWDGMADLERKPFNEPIESTNKFINHVMQKHYTTIQEDKAASKETSMTSSLHPEQIKDVATDWRSLSEPDKEKFKDIRPFDLGMDFVIEKRDRLHQLYSPRELNILEFISKTRPKYPKSSRVWFLRTESQSIKSPDAMKRWYDISDDTKSLYTRCAVLDSKRYSLEKNAWITKIVRTNLEDDDFTLSDFKLTEIQSRIESLGSIVELSRYLPPNVSLKRPREAFSLFIEAYQYQIREARPKFQFGPHLRACSKAWSELSDQEKQFYRDESLRMKAKRKQLLADEFKAEDSKLSIPIALFKSDKNSFGPCRVAHLYPKIPSILNYWAGKNNIKQRPLKPLWESLNQAEKEAIHEEHAKLRHEYEETKRRIDQKHQLVKQLIREALRLEILKRDLGLIGKSDKAVKNMYTDVLSSDQKRAKVKRPIVSVGSARSWSGSVNQSHV